MSYLLRYGKAIGYYPLSSYWWKCICIIMLRTSFWTNLYRYGKTKQLHNFKKGRGLVESAESITVEYKVLHSAG